MIRYKFFYCVIASFLFLLLVTSAHSESYSPLINGHVPTIHGTLSVSNIYYGETTDYKADFVLPKGVQVGWITIGMDTGAQDLSNAELVVTGLPAGTAIINRSKWRSGSDTVQYIISPEIVLSEDTKVTILLKNVINQKAPQINFDDVPQQPPAVGFWKLYIMAFSNNTTESVYFINDQETSRLNKRSTRIHPFETQVNFESDNNYFGETANHIFSFNLPEGMYIGRIGINYDFDIGLDLSNAYLEVTGLPSGVAKINTDVHFQHIQEHTLSYTLPATILLEKDTRVFFKLFNVKNQPFSTSGNSRVGITDQIFISENTNSNLGGFSLLDYNYNYPPIKFYGKWETFLINKLQPLPQLIVDSPVSPPKNIITPPSAVVAVTTTVVPVQSISAVYTENISNVPSTTITKNLFNISSVVQDKILVPTPFTRTLKVGMSGADVKKLQSFLNNNGFIVTKKGVGSPGKENTYFGFFTKKALIKFQKNNKIKTTGYTDAKTLNLLNKSIH